MKGSSVVYGRRVLSAELLEVSFLEVSTVLRYERGAWSMVTWLRQSTNEFAPSVVSTPCGNMNAVMRAICSVRFKLLRGVGKYYCSDRKSAVIFQRVPCVPNDAPALCDLPENDLTFWGLEPCLEDAKSLSRKRIYPRYRSLWSEG